MGPTANLLLKQKLWGGAQQFVFSRVLQAILMHIPVWKSLQVLPSVSIYIRSTSLDSQTSSHNSAFDFSPPSLIEHHAIPSGLSINSELINRIERKLLPEHTSVSVPTPHHPQHQSQSIQRPFSAPAFPRARRQGEMRAKTKCAHSSPFLPGDGSGVGPHYLH